MPRPEFTRQIGTSGNRALAWDSLAGRSAHLLLRKLLRTYEQRVGGYEVDGSLWEVHPPQEVLEAGVGAKVGDRVLIRLPRYFLA